MSNSLPNEALHEIFIQLSLFERLECMLVCRHWYNALSKRSLLQNIHFGSDQEFNKFMEMSQRMPSRASQVEILTIKTTSTIDKRNVSNLFPNLRIFKFHKSNSQKTDFCNIPFESVNTISKLEEIYDEGECEFTRQLIKSTPCPNLTQLELQFGSRFDLKEEILVYLKNAPNLEKLTFTYCYIGPEDLEMLHENLPALQSLKLDSMNLIECELPQNIIPATSVTDITVNIDYATNIVSYPIWYEYVAKKYTNLTSFFYRDDIMHRYGYPDLIMKIYRNGIIPLYKNNGSRLDRFFGLNIAAELDLFNKMDDFGCRFKYVYLGCNYENPIFDQLAVSNQSKSVRTLKLVNTSISSPILLQNFKSLTTLEIDTNSDRFWRPINFTDYVNAFPASLTSFSAGCSILKVNEIPKRLLNIKTLSIKCHTLTKKLSEIISACFPKLTELTLEGFVTKNWYINLPTIHLESYTVYAYHKHGKSHGFVVESLEDSQIRYYAEEKEQKYFMHCLAKPTTAENLQDRIIIHLACANVKKMYLHSPYELLAKDTGDD